MGKPTSNRQPIQVEYEPSWLSWVGATTTCLKALGIECDLAEVAGVTGYAFMVCIEKGLCPSGPTMFDWGILDGGVNLLGRSTLGFANWDCHTGEHICDRTREHCLVAYEIAERETAAGRPCVLWGAYIPEFAVVTLAQDRAYTVKSVKGHCGEPEPPLPYDGLDAPGGPYVLAFPSPTKSRAGSLHNDRFAIGRAVQLLTLRSPFANYSYGLAAYDRWIEALEKDAALPFGNAYSAQCYAESRRHARDFVSRVATRRGTRVPPLTRAAEHYAAAATALAEVTELFPFPPQGDKLTPAQREQAIPALAVAKKAEGLALDELAATIEMDWGEETASAAAG